MRRLLPALLLAPDIAQLPGGVLLLAALCSTPLVAQEAAKPIIETTLEKSAAVPGQPVALRLNIFVPTWMPKPPDLPSFEAPNLRVRVPPKGSIALSRRVNGETWSGISRRYLLTPMVPGRIALPPQDIQLTYANPDGASPLKVTLQTPAMSITGIVPAGAEGLDPFIAANGLKLTQTLSGPTTGMKPGDSVVRTLTARIEGASPYVLAPLLPQVRLPAIKIYPATPQVSEDDRTEVLSGTRVESQTWMAVGGGAGRAPAVRIAWFNLETGKIESAEAPGFDISITGPPPTSATSRTTPDWRMILAMLVALLAAVTILRQAWPRAQKAFIARREAWLASEVHARRKLLAAISRHDYPATAHWLAQWRGIVRDPDPDAMRCISERMARIGATIYRSERTPDESKAWRDLAIAIPSGYVGSGHTVGELPDINPQGTQSSHH